MSDYEEAKDQFMRDAAGVRILERWVYPNCENCGHKARSHYSEGILPLPSRCIAGCLCTSPAHLIRQRYLESAVQEVFDENPYS